MPFRLQAAAILVGSLVAWPLVVAGLVGAGVWRLCCPAGWTCCRPRPTEPRVDRHLSAAANHLVNFATTLVK